MSVVLELKKRTQTTSLQVPVQPIQDALAQGEVEGKNTLWNFFKELGTVEPTVHDKNWLEMITNWIATDEQGQPKPVSLTKQAKWFKLAERISALDPEKEGKFTLSQFQADLIWSRLTNEEFTIIRMPVPFISFIMEFQEAIGKQFPDVEIEEEKEKEQ
jgi:hypothetical protein